MSPELDPFSVEHGELQAKVTALEQRVSEIDRRQREVLATLSAMKGAQRILWVIFTILSVVVGMVINMLGAIRSWWEKP